MVLIAPCTTRTARNTIIFSTLSLMMMMMMSEESLIKRAAFRLVKIVARSLVPKELQMSYLRSCRSCGSAIPEKHCAPRYSVQVRRYLYEVHEPHILVLLYIVYYLVL